MPYGISGSRIHDIIDSRKLTDNDILFRNTNSYIYQSWLTINTLCVISIIEFCNNQCTNAVNLDC